MGGGLRDASLGEFEFGYDFGDHEYIPFFFNNLEVKPHYPFDVCRFISKLKLDDNSLDVVKLKIALKSTD